MSISWPCCALLCSTNSSLWTLVIGALLIMDSGKILDDEMQLLLLLLWPVCIFQPNDSTLDFCVNIFRLLGCYFQQLVIFLIFPLCEQRLANMHVRL